jgi:hypothetical protein
VSKQSSFHGIPPFEKTLSTRARALAGSVNASFMREKHAPISKQVIKERENGWKECVIFAPERKGADGMETGYV